MGDVGPLQRMRAKLNERTEGADSWWLLALSSIVGFLLGFTMNLGESLGYAATIGLMGAGLLGVPVLILICVDRLRRDGSHDAADPENRSK